MEHYIYKTNNQEYKLLVDLEEPSIWFTINQLCLLFNKTRKTLTKHLSIILQEYYPYYSSKIANIGKKYEKITHISGKKPSIYPLIMAAALAEKYGSDEIEKLKMWLDSLLQNEIENSVPSEEEDDKDTSKGFQITRLNIANLDLEVRISLEEETVWLTQEEIASLFDVTQQNISLHINNIIEMGELDFEGIHKYYLYMGRTGRQYKMSLYNLDLILAVGYRVNSVRAIEFRRWASSVLKKYLFKGDVNKIDNTSNWEGFKYIFSNLKKVEERLSKVEEKVNKNEIPNEILADSINYYAIYNGLISIIATANKSVVVIDPYADKDVLSIFSKIGEEINKFIVYGDYSKIDENMITTFKNEFNNSYFAKSDLFHDRFIIIDEKDVYQMGSSINYLGKKISLINRVETPKIIELIIKTTKELFKL